MRRMRLDFTDDPLYFTASFDGSQRFAMWLDTIRFARSIEKRFGKTVRFTYFINTCFYDTKVKGSQIGRALSHQEVLVRRALTQLAINEGHEIANHGVGHDDGGSWSLAQWQKEIATFHEQIDKTLFKPVRDGEGRAVFPRFAPVAGAPTASIGSRCERDADCKSGQCLLITDEQRFCSQGCNRRHPCPSGTACGTPNFNKDKDVCIPLPKLPLRHDGALLFDAEGKPNLAHPALKPYRIIGFRAPFLAFNDGLIETLMSRRYLYEASQVARPGGPLRIGYVGLKRAMLGFALMQHQSARTIPMDYNYRRAGVSGQRMAKDYRNSLLSAYRHPHRYPWNVGHHFALWRNGAYWTALQEAISFAAAGCPDETGARHCPKVAMVSFRQLARRVVRMDKRARKETPKAK